MVEGHPHLKPSTPRLVSQVVEAEIDLPVGRLRFRREAIRPRRPLRCVAVSLQDSRLPPLLRAGDPIAYRVAKDERCGSKWVSCGVVPGHLHHGQEPGADRKMVMLAVLGI